MKISAAEEFIVIVCSCLKSRDADGEGENARTTNSNEDPASDKRSGKPKSSSTLFLKNCFGLHRHKKRQIWNTRTGRDNQQSPSRSAELECDRLALNWTTIHSYIFDPGKSNHHHFLSVIGAPAWVCGLIAKAVNQRRENKPCGYPMTNRSGQKGAVCDWLKASCLRLRLTANAAHQDRTKETSLSHDESVQFTEEWQTETGSSYESKSSIIGSGWARKSSNFPISPCTFTAELNDKKQRQQAVDGRQVKTRQGKARQGKARQGKARQGKARQGKERRSEKRREKMREEEKNKPFLAGRFQSSIQSDSNGRWW